MINDILKREIKIRENEVFQLKARNQTDMYRSISENFVKQRKKMCIRDRSDSTLHIGTLASTNVNNIVNDTSKYDEYKEKVKDLEKELQTRKDTFEKMTEPLVYVCLLYTSIHL